MCRWIYKKFNHLLSLKLKYINSYKTNNKKIYLISNKIFGYLFFIRIKQIYFNCLWFAYSTYHNLFGYILKSIIIKYVLLSDKITKSFLGKVYIFFFIYLTGKAFTRDTQQYQNMQYFIRETAVFNIFKFSFYEDFVSSELHRVLKTVTWLYDTLEII